MTRAIEAGVDFLLSRDPAVADYPAGWGNTRPSGSWFKLGFPSGYVADVLQNLEVLAELGQARDPRLANAIEWLLGKQDARGSWMNEYAYNGKTWVDVDRQGQPSKWVTLRSLPLPALRAGQAAASTADHHRAPNGNTGSFTAGSSRLSSIDHDTDAWTSTIPGTIRTAASSIRAVERLFDPPADRRHAVPDRDVEPCRIEPQDLEDDVLADGRCELVIRADVRAHEISPADDADELVVIDDRQAIDLAGGHDGGGLGDRSARRDGDRRRGSSPRPP